MTPHNNKSNLPVTQGLLLNWLLNDLKQQKEQNRLEGHSTITRPMTEGIARINEIFKNITSKKQINNGNNHKNHN